MSRAASASPGAVSCSSEGCLTRTGNDVDAALCPVSQTIGSTVPLITVKALLKGSALRRLEGKSYRFCPDRDCDVIYFDRETNSMFGKRDLTVRVGQKEIQDPVTLCYCFDFSLADLRTQGAGIPTIIAAEIKAGHCACEVKNPQGSCCLGNVSNTLKQIQVRQSGLFEHG